MRRAASREPLIQAQAQPLDPDTLAYLRRTYRKTTTTRGWPARKALRFESDDGLTLTVWDNHDQCDWWISSPSPDTTRQHVAVLRAYSDLASSFWSNDDPGIELLATLG